jgi:hypothetical protein
MNHWAVHHRQKKFFAFIIIEKKSDALSGNGVDLWQYTVDLSDRNKTNAEKSHERNY